jgi:hypothetical protein
LGFKLFEIASFFSRPVCLYEFTWGGKSWRYTSADRVIDYGVDADDNPIEWLPISISDNGFTQGAAPEPFTITLPRNLEFVQLFNGTPPSTAIAIIARRFHKDDTDQEASVYWVGTIGSVKGVDAVKAEVIGLSISQTTRRTGLRLGWEVNCPHALFDAGCRAVKSLFQFDTTITAIIGTSITVAGIKPTLTGQNYAGGFIEWDATGSGSIDRRPIDSFATGTTFNLLGRADRLVGGQAVSIFPGCDLSTEVCQNVFNNLPNHGGFKFMSKKSPFDGNPVF